MLRRSFAFLLSAVLASSFCDALELTAYPQRDQISIGVVPVVLKPERAFTFTAPLTAPLEILIAEPRGEAKEGEILAFIDRERVEMEGELLGLEKQYSTTQEIPEKRLSVFQSLRQIEDRKAEIDQQLAFIKKIETNPELGRLYSKDSSQFETNKQAATERLGEEKETVDVVLNNLESPSNRELGESIITLKLQKRVWEYERKLEESQITMPFTGTYQFLFPIETGRIEYQVMQGEPLVLVEDLSRMYGVVEVRGVQWRLFDKAQLRLRLPGLGTRSAMILGKFHHSITEEKGSRSALLYYFAYDAKDVPYVARIRGGLVSGEILVDVSEERPYVVPKLDLLTAHPNAFGTSWEDGVMSLYDDVKTVYVGQDVVGVVFNAK